MRWFGQFEVTNGCLTACLIWMRVAYHQALEKNPEKDPTLIPTEVREVRLEMVRIALEVNNGSLTAGLTWVRGSH